MKYLLFLNLSPFHIVFIVAQTPIGFLDQLCQAVLKEDNLTKLHKWSLKTSPNSTLSSLLNSYFNQLHNGKSFILTLSLIILFEEDKNVDLMQIDEEKLKNTATNVDRMEIERPQTEGQFLLQEISCSPPIR